MPFNEYLKQKVAFIDSHLSKLIPKEEIPYKNLFEAARYSLLAGGKRLRPILLLASAEALGADLERAISAASAVELVHTYSLIHDDLPCMDDDDFRRGKPSLHKAFSEAHAVLTGDYLLSYAFELLSSDPLLRADQKVELIAMLAKGCGGKGMIAGQVMDIEAEGKNIDQNVLQNIHRHKTGALITASVTMGGIIADADQEQLNDLSSYGDAIGLAFQIMDDVLDVKASWQKHGSTISSDMVNNKTTYVTVMGLEKAESLAKEITEGAKAHAFKLGRSAEPLAQLADYIVARSF